MRRAAAASLACAALLVGGCGGGDDGGGGGDGGGGSDETQATEQRNAITKQPGGEKIVRDAAEAYIKGKADMMASLQQDLRENDTKTLIDDLWDLRNVIYEFDQALRRVEFAPGRAEHLSLTILEIDSAAIKRIDPILDAKKPPPGLADAVRRAVEDAEAIETEAQKLLALK